MLPDFIQSSLKALGSTASNPLWKDLQTANGGLVYENADAVNRPLFVNLQAFVETCIANALKFDRISAAIGVIHTKYPATSLRSNGTISEGLVASDVFNDPNRQATVLKRPDVIRKYLAAGGTLIAAYHECSMKENIPGMDVFHELKCQFPLHLKDTPIQNFSDEMSGATYLIREKTGAITCFSIKATQAHQPDAQTTMGVWLGSLELEKVWERFQQIEDFLKPQGIDMLAQLGKLARDTHQHKAGRVR